MLFFFAIVIPVFPRLARQIGIVEAFALVTIDVGGGEIGKAEAAEMWFQPLPGIPEVFDGIGCFLQLVPVDEIADELADAGGVADDFGGLLFEAVVFGLCLVPGAGKGDAVAGTFFAVADVEDPPAFFCRVFGYGQGICPILRRCFRISGVG